MDNINYEKLEKAGHSISVALIICIVPLFIGFVTWLTIAAVWADQNAGKPQGSEDPHPYIWPFNKYVRDKNQAPPYAVVDTNDTI